MARSARCLLALLREHGIRLALVTGKGVGTATMSLTHFGLDGVFDPVETGSPLGVVKAAAIARVVAGWQVETSGVIYVGDAVADVEAARAAGVRAIGAAWAPGAIPAELAAAPDALFASASDFRAWLLTTLGPSPARRTSGGSPPAR